PRDPDAAGLPHLRGRHAPDEDGRLGCALLRARPNRRGGDRKSCTLLSETRMLAYSVPLAGPAELAFTTPHLPLTLQTSPMRFSLLTLATAVLLLAPQVVLAQNSLTASPAVSVGTDQEPDQSHPAGGDVVITQSVSSTVDGGGVSCGNSGAGYTTENSYWRLFDLAAMGFNDDITL